MQRLGCTENGFLFRVFHAQGLLKSNKVHYNIMQLLLSQNVISWRTIFSRGVTLHFINGCVTLDRITVVTVHTKRNLDYPP